MFAVNLTCMQDLIYEISAHELDAFFEFLMTKLPHRKKIPALINTLRRRPFLIPILLQELDAAIAAFNTFQKTYDNPALERKDLPHANYLIVCLGQRNLPTVAEIIILVKENLTQISKEIIPLLDQYQFLDTMTPTEKLAAAFTIFLYRSTVLSLWPDLREKGVLVGSALEEMVVLMAIKGKKTRLFEAVKPWIKDDKEEGFSPSLVKAIRKL